MIAIIRLASMRAKFQEWYGMQICPSLREYSQLPVNLHLIDLLCRKNSAGINFGAWPITYFTISNSDSKWFLSYS